MALHRKLVQLQQCGLVQLKATIHSHNPIVVYVNQLFKSNNGCSFSLVTTEGLRAVILWCCYISYNI